MKSLALIILLFLSNCITSQIIHYNKEKQDCLSDTCVSITIDSKTILLIGDYVLENSEKNTFSISGHLNIIEKDSETLFYNNFTNNNFCRIAVCVKPNLISFSFNYYLFDNLLNKYSDLSKYVTMNLYLDDSGVFKRKVVCHYDKSILNKKEVKTFCKSLNDELFKSEVYSIKFYYSLFAGSMLGYENAIYYFTNFLELAKKHNLTKELGPEMGDYFILLEIYKASINNW